MLLRLSVVSHAECTRKKNLEPSAGIPRLLRACSSHARVFVHASAVREAGLRFLNENDAIEFEIQDGDKGPSAVNLKKIS